MLAAETTGDKDTEKIPASRALEDSRHALTAQFENGESHHSFSNTNNRWQQGTCFHRIKKGAQPMSVNPLK